MKKYWLPVLMLIIFETIAVTLWLAKDNLFYLLNFSYIGISIFRCYLYVGINTQGVLCSYLSDYICSSILDS